MLRAINRRRFIAIAAALAATATLLHPRGARAHTWRGIALGADASLTIEHDDEAEARAAIDACLAEIARLESIFSLYRPDSALMQLNATGLLNAAPADLRVLLSEALRIAELSRGAFDPTVQPLWDAYARHFACSDPDPAGPSTTAIADALELVDWRKVAVEGGRVALGRPQMALTLNGIAQGYITDCVGDLLRARGFTHVLVNLGEQLVLGPRWDGSAWRAGIADPTAPHRVIGVIALRNGAIATSGGYGCRFDKNGRFTHILDPATGVPAARWASVTVLAERATLADGLSTALSVVAPPQAREPLGNVARAFVVPLGERAGYWL